MKHLKMARPILAALAAFSISWPAAAASLVGDYYIAPLSHPDFQNGIDGGIVAGLVQNTLGPNGLPVVSAYGAAYGGPSGPITDVNALGELMWWTPGGNGIIYEKTQTDALPLMHTANFFPDGYPGNSQGFRVAKWKGVFNLPSPGTATFTLGADDDAWLFVDGQLVVDNGGVKALNYAPTTVSGLTAGAHQVDLFFADRHTTQSAIVFGADVELSPIPEPASLALLGLGAPALLAIRRRK
jgi:fibro-slime domain-containing protein